MKLLVGIIALIMLLTLGIYSAIHLYVAPILMIGMIIYSTTLTYMVAKDMASKQEVTS
jgi:hypothetical protein